MATLHQYLADNKLSQAAFADRVGISRGFLNDILSGRRQPALPMALKIISATGGEVDVQSLAMPEKAGSA